jgi:16S rRNA processing protein RimM
MAYSYYIQLGHITKVSGFEGAVTVKLERSFIENIPQMESVFLEIEGRQVPFFISESYYPGGDVLRLTFIDYNTADKVSEFKGCRLYLTSEIRTNERKDDFGDITGYEVFTEANLLLGQIKEVIQNPGQWLLNITSPDKKEILVPLHEDFIILLDDKKKIMVLKIPEGLLEIN